MPKQFVIFVLFCYEKPPCLTLSCAKKNMDCLLKDKELLYYFSRCSFFCPVSLWSKTMWYEIKYLEFGKSALILKNCRPRVYQTLQVPPVWETSFMV